jgi:hypothetical protein
MPLKEPLSLEEIAIAAKEYARNYIKKGATQLENNHLPEEYRLPLPSGIDDLRNEIEHAIAINPDKNAYDAEINTLKKYSLGNCSEMALLALDYVLTHHPGIFAQIYAIANGDHEFLSIGKGKEAFICDPWSNKVYPFHKWKNNLENYCFQAIELSKEAKIIQEIKLKELRSMLPAHFSLKKSKEKIFIYKGVNEIIGETYLPHFVLRNYTHLLHADQTLVPVTNSDSVSLYNKGATYRRAKIKDVLYFLRPFEDILASQIYNLKRLLNGQRLLQDGCLQVPLLASQITLHEQIIKKGLTDLKNIEQYLQYAKLTQTEMSLRIKFSILLEQSNKIKLIKRIRLFAKFYPISEQLDKINDAIDCLNQLLEGRLARDIHNKFTQTSEYTPSVSLTASTETLDVEQSIFDNHIKGYRQIKQFSSKLDHYHQQINDLTSTLGAYTDEAKQEIKQLITDLKKMINDYLELPTPVNSGALYYILNFSKGILIDDLNLSSQHSFISSIDKLIDQLDNFEKGASIPPRNFKNFESSSSTLFQSAPVNTQTDNKPTASFAEKIYPKV